MRFRGAAFPGGCFRFPGNINRWPRSVTEKQAKPTARQTRDRPVPAALASPEGLPPRASLLTQVGAQGARVHPPELGGAHADSADSIPGAAASSACGQEASQVPDRVLRPLRQVRRDLSANTPSPRAVPPRAAPPRAVRLLCCGLS